MNNITIIQQIHNSQPLCISNEIPLGTLIMNLIPGYNISC